MRKLILLSLSILLLTISYAQEKQNENMKFLEKNISKFDLTHEASYQAGYSMTYAYKYNITNGVLKETGTYVSTKQKFTSTANLKDLIKVEKDIQDGKHESLVLTFKEGTVSFVNGNFKEKQSTISIQFCSKSEQNTNFDLNCKKAKYTLQDELPIKATWAFQGLINGSK